MGATQVARRCRVAWARAGCSAGARLSGHVAGAALDVFAPEPIPAGHGILGRANVILAPHIASVSPAAVKRLRSGAAELAVMAIRGERLPSVVNGVPSAARS